MYQQGYSYMMKLAGLEKQAAPGFFRRQADAVLNLGKNMEARTAAKGKLDDVAGILTENKRIREMGYDQMFEHEQQVPWYKPEFMMDKDWKQKRQMFREGNQALDAQEQAITPKVQQAQTEYDAVNNEVKRGVRNVGIGVTGTGALGATGYNAYKNRQNNNFGPYEY